VRARAAAARLRELVGASRAASRAYGVSPVWAARTALRMRRLNGFAPSEALRDGILDPRIDEPTRERYIGRAMRRPAQDRLNPVSLEPFTEQKIVFYDYCAALGIPVPELYGTAGRAGGWSRISGRAIPDRRAFGAFVRDELPGEFVVKPAFGHEGLGIRVLERAGDAVVGSDGRRVAPEALHDALREDPEFDLHLVQARLRNHPAVEEIAGSPVLQTLRINTIVRPDGSVLVFGAVLKLATGTGDGDNFHNGETGNGFCEISLDDGTLGPLVLPSPRGVGFVAVDTAPGTGCRVAGRRIPFAAEAGELVRRGAPSFLPMRTLGWDVAITADGPSVIEANNWWRPFRPLPPEAWELLVGERRPVSAPGAGPYTERSSGR
jgi:hypothetical protein